MGLSIKDLSLPDWPQAIATRKIFMPIDTIPQQILKDFYEDSYIYCDNGKAEF